MSRSWRRPSATAEEKDMTSTAPTPLETLHDQDTRHERVLILRGLDQLVDRAPAWNALWSRSLPCQPTARAEGIENWCRSFSSPESLVAVCVMEGDRMTAGLPLIRSNVAGAVRVFQRPVNCWSDSGDLLVDHTADRDRALRQLVLAMRKAGIRFLRLKDINSESPAWVGFQRAVSAEHGHCLITSTSPVGVIDVRGDWEVYEKSLSGNHRRAVKKSHRKLEKSAAVRVERHQTFADGEIDRLLEICFEIEDRGWKGQQGTSVLRTPGMMDYMRREAAQVAQAGLLEVWLLLADDNPIAFEYCHMAGGVCFAQKIGYDPAFAQHGPGRLLRYLQLQELWAEPDCEVFDMLGEMCETKAKWATRTYPHTRMYVSLGNPLSRWALRGYGMLKSTRAWLRPPAEPRWLTELSAGQNS